ncbi:MAG: ABC transporter permease [Bryobacteraceae bacterium]
MPDWKTIVRDRLAHLRLKGTEEIGLVDELAQHLEDTYRELRSGGASEEEAHRKAESGLDDLYPLAAGMGRSERMPKHEAVPAGAMPAGNFIEDTWRDLRYTARTMGKNPLFVLFVVLTLALGIGANTTVFTVINTLLLNPLPVQNAAGLAAVAGAETKSRSKVVLLVSYPDLKDYQARNQVFASLAGYVGPCPVTLDQNGTSERMFSELVTGNYFSALGLKPARGRFFLPEEDSTPGAHPVAVMNYATWRARFGGENDILGKILRLNNVVFTVVGVAPPGFIGVNAVFGPDVWIPAAMAEQLLPNQMHGALSERNKAVFLGVGRLKSGVSRAQAQADLETIASALARQYPETNEGHTAAVHPITDVLFGSSGSGSTPFLFGSVVLLIVVAIVLLIACSNVANLLLARAAARQQEIAVRLAMGASRARLVRQLLTESLFLAFMSGLVGLAIGYASLQLVWSSLPGEASANLVKPKMDATVFVFTLVVALLTGFVFGTIPALRASRTSVAETLKEESRASGKSRRRVSLANALLVGQVAFSFVALMTAALFLRSIQRAYDMDPGFQTRHLAVLLTNPGQAGYAKAQTKAFYKDVREQVAAMPGVESASWASNMPLWAQLASGIKVEGREQRSKADIVTTVLNIVDLHYFETAGIPIEKGREFTELDQEHSTPVAIVNEKMARDYWPNGEVLGKRIQLPGEIEMRQIVGIARNANYSTLGEPPQACVYVPLEQNYWDAMTLYVRTKGDPQPLLIPLQREVRQLGPRISVNDVRTGRTIIDQGLFQAKMGVAMLGVLGLLALGLASIGLYGIMAYSVNLRVREIGVRMALGAARANVLLLILKQGMTLVVAGVAIGLGAALLVGHFLTRLLYGVGASDPVSVSGAAIVLLVVALAACYLPAHRASRIDPLAALREG